MVLSSRWEAYESFQVTFGFDYYHVPAPLVRQIRLMVINRESLMKA